MSAGQTGQLSIVIVLSVPHDEAYKLARGDVMRKNISIGTWTCTEEFGIKMAAVFREANPSIAGQSQISWNGPRDL